MRDLIIRTEKLSKYFGPIQAVKDLTLDVEPGEVFGLLGASGAGKTSTIRMLLGLVHPNQGDAYLFGLNIRAHPLAIHRRTGYAPTLLHLWPEMTVQRFIEHLAQLQGRMDWDYVRSLVNLFHIDLRQTIHSMSSNQRASLNLIQALVHRPDLIILDDPLEDLEPPFLQIAINLIAELRSEGRTILLSTRSMPNIERICDRVGILRKGTLVSVERVIQFKARLLRKMEIRFAEQVPLDLFSSVPNIKDLSLDRMVLRCTIKGDPDGLVKTAGQYRILDLVSRESTLEEVVLAYFGEDPYAV
jgi:ABC-2 type transport system ATP-binding protein